MNLRINRSIAEQTKVSYAIESAGPLPYDIDCGEGINTVMVPPAAKQAFKELDFEMMRPYPHSVDAVSYTHLDVYKRQVLSTVKCRGYCGYSCKKSTIIGGSM